MKKQQIYENSYQCAIKARQHHYKNFNYWMNFYAIIIGALFVGYYEIKDDFFLKGIIALVGFSTTFAWLQSFRGYYHWIKQWIEVVKFHEEQYIQSVSDTDEDDTTTKVDINCSRVYSLYYKSNNEDSRCPLKSRNISTQKMTLGLIFVLLVAWLMLIIYTTMEYFCNIIATKFSKDYFFICNKLCNLSACFIGCTVGLSLILFFILFVFIRKSDSDVSGHYRLTKKWDIDGYEYSILPPEKKND